MPLSHLVLTAHLQIESACSSVRLDFMPRNGNMFLSNFSHLLHVLENKADCMLPYHIFHIQFFAAIPMTSSFTIVILFSNWL